MSVLEELLDLEKNVSSINKTPSGSDTTRLTKDIKETYTKWLLRFPTQCVLVAESIMWERQVHKALEKQDSLELSTQR